MRDVNKVFLVGKVAEKPVIGAGGSPVSFKLMVTRAVSEEDDGERHLARRVLLLHVETKSREAEYAKKYLSPGALCAVEGCIDGLHDQMPKIEAARVSMLVAPPKVDEER